MPFKFKLLLEFKQLSFKALKLVLLNILLVLKLVRFRSLKQF